MTPRNSIWCFIYAWFWWTILIYVGFFYEFF